MQYFKFVRAAQWDSEQYEYESSKAYKLATLEMHLLKLQLTPKMVAFQVNPPTWVHFTEKYSQVPSKQKYITNKKSNYSWAECLLLLIIATGQSVSMFFYPINYL